MGSQDPQLQAMQLAITHRHMVEAYAFAIVRNFHLAEDVYQEVALILVKDWQRIPDGPGFTPWLKEMVRRKSRELWRKQHRTARLSDEALAQVGDAFPVEPEQDLPGHMARCLEKLHGDAKRAVLGRYRDDLEVPLIAAQLGRTVQSAYAILKRARLALKQCVEQAQAREGVRT